MLLEKQVLSETTLHETIISAQEKYPPTLRNNRFCSTEYPNTLYPRLSPWLRPLQNYLSSKQKMMQNKTIQLYWCSFQIISSNVSAYGL